MNSIAKKAVTATFILAACLTASCATVEGAGKDISTAGKTISKTSKDVAKGN